MTKTPHHNDLRGAPIAARLIAEVKEATSELKMAGWNAKLMSITIGDVTAVDLYVRNQRRRAAEAGIEFQEQHYPETITQIEIESALRALNADPRVTGIIIQRPLPKHISLKRLQATIKPMKDVEGMHPASIGNIVYNELDLAPCTAAAAVELLKSTGLELKGLEVVIVGHSEIVGKPIAFLLMSEGATVTVCHHMTRSLAAHARRADALSGQSGAELEYQPVPLPQSGGRCGARTGRFAGAQSRDETLPRFSCDTGLSPLG